MPSTDFGLLRNQTVIAYIGYSSPHPAGS